MCIINTKKHSPRQVKHMKTKNIYKARLINTEGLSDLLCSKTGNLAFACLLQGDVSWSTYLIVPDFDKTDRIEFDILFDAEFRKGTTVKGGDRFMFDFGQIYGEAGLREIEIVDVVKGEPINYLENKERYQEGGA